MFLCQHNTVVYSIVSMSKSFDSRWFCIISEPYDLIPPGEGQHKANNLLTASLGLFPAGGGGGGKGDFYRMWGVYPPSILINLFLLPSGLRYLSFSSPGIAQYITHWPPAVGWSDFETKLLHFLCCAKLLQDPNSKISCLNVAY